MNVLSFNSICAFKATHCKVASVKSLVLCSVAFWGREWTAIVKRVRSRHAHLPGSKHHSTRGGGGIYFQINMHGLARAIEVEEWVYAFFLSCITSAGCCTYHLPAHMLALYAEVFLFPPSVVLKLCFPCTCLPPLSFSASTICIRRKEGVGETRRMSVQRKGLVVYLEVSLL